MAIRSAAGRILPSPRLLVWLLLLLVVGGGGVLLLSSSFGVDSQQQEEPHARVLAHRSVLLLSDVSNLWF